MRMLRVSLTVLLVLAGLILTAPAPQAEAPDVEGSYPYLLYFNGARVGWAKSDVSVIEYEGRKVIHELETSHIELRRSFDGQSFTVNSTSKYWYELDGTAIKKVDERTDGAQKRKSEVTYGKGKTTIRESIDGGPPQETVVDHGEREVYSDFRAWCILKADDRVKPGVVFKFWGVDESGHALTERTWNVNGNVKRKLSDDEVIEGTEIQIITGGRALKVVFGEDDWPLFVEAGSGFTMERVEEIPDPFEPEPAVLRNTMEANVAIRNSDKLESLEIHFEYEHDDGDGIPPLCESNTYHDVVKYEGGYAIRMKAQKLDDDFECAYPLEEVPDDIKTYLDPTAMCQSDDEDLIKQAQGLARGADDARQVADRIMRWTGRHLKGGSGDTGSASAKQAFLEKRGDCTEHSVLFVALARAAGLPARNVSGLIYATAPDASEALFGFHQWAEVWLGEWVPVDATVNELGTSARFVQFEYDEPGHTYGAGRSGRCLKQDIRPVIDRYTLSTGKKWRRHDAPEFEFD